MIALGIDVSTKKIAVAGITEAGEIRTHAIAVPPGQVGARRLCLVRSVLSNSLTAARWQDTCAVVVEIPWAPKSRGSGFALMSAAAVVCEAVQAAFPGAVVMEVPAPSWKLDTVGRGTAPKSECMAFARSRGYEGTDQDLADALCMSACAWHRWERTTNDGEAA